MLYSCWRFDRDGQAVMAALDAYYAEDPEQTLDFCRTYGVGVLVVDERTLSGDYLEERPIFYDLTPANGRRAWKGAAILRWNALQLRGDCFRVVGSL